MLARAFTRPGCPVVSTLRGAIAIADDGWAFSVEGVMLGGALGWRRRLCVGPLIAPDDGGEGRGADLVTRCQSVAKTRSVVVRRGPSWSLALPL
jgi:hypothetical protein